MGEPKTPPPAKLVASVIFSGLPSGGGRELLDEAVSLLEGEYGPSDCRSPVMPFDFTDYYGGEMGENLHRQFVSFERLVERDRLADVKLFTNEIERKFLDERGCRRVNIDPGLLCPESLVLASCKNFSQRIYLGRGVFAEVTLIYREKTFRSLPWTFPDYDSAAVKSVLSGIRSLLMKDLRARRAII
jgi:hypothetical protein